MGRRKIEIKLIKNKTSRQVTFSKRRRGLRKKAEELAVLCDAQLCLIVFSSTGKLHQYTSPSTSPWQIIERYMGVHQDIDPNHTAQGEIALQMRRLRDEMETLRMSIRQLTGEDISTLSVDSLTALEQQLKASMGKVRRWMNATLCTNYDMRETAEMQMTMMNQSSSTVYHELPGDHLQAQLLQNYGFPTNAFQSHTSQPNVHNIQYSNEFQLCNRQESRAVSPHCGPSTGCPHQGPSFFFGCPHNYSRP